MIRRLFRRIRNRFIDLRLELNLTLVDFLDSRRKTLLRRKRNLNKKG